MAIPVIVCEKCTTENGLLPQVSTACRCINPILIDKWECQTCGAIWALESEADLCDEENQDTLLIQALEDGDIDPLYLDMALEAKARRKDKNFSLMK